MVIFILDGAKISSKIANLQPRESRDGTHTTVSLLASLLLLNCTISNNVQDLGRPSKMKMITILFVNLINMQFMARLIVITI